MSTETTTKLPAIPPLSSSDLFGAFGREVFKLVSDRVADMTLDEGDDEIMEIAGKHGLATQVAYDPEAHGNVPEAEPGQTIWWWGDAPNARPEWRGAKSAEMQTGRAIPRPLQADS